MIIIDLEENCVDDNAIKVKTQGTLTNQQLVYNLSDGFAYVYFESAAQGDISPIDQQDGTGWWCKDKNIKCLNLSEYKDYRYAQIDKKSGELIANGYVHATKTFSLSHLAQTNLLGIYVARDELWMTYPITYNTIDDHDTHDIQDASEIEAMYQLALGTKKTHLDNGTALKNQIREASTATAVQAIIDNR